LGQVLGGTINCGTGYLEIKTSALAADSAVARMAALVDMVRPLCLLPVAAKYDTAVYFIFSIPPAKFHAILASQIG
jgi:hypothetical protein